MFSVIKLAAATVLLAADVYRLTWNQIDVVLHATAVDAKVYETPEEGFLIWCRLTVRSFFLNKISLLGCQKFGIIAHELLHAVGMWQRTN